jgi:large subunit ribosomal protein L30
MTETSLGQIKITQVRSAAGRIRKQKDILKALGLKRIRHTVTHQNSPEIRGMVKKVLHLVEYEELR